MLCIIQSRMSSNRLPGKMLMDLNGRTLLGRVLDRVRYAKKISKIIVATSIEKEDDAIEQFCIQEKIFYYRGELNNVYRRFRDLTIRENTESFVRINGDSPLIDPAIIDFAVDLYYKSNHDIITNVFPRSFPKGQSVEVIKSRSFIEIQNFNMNLSQKEHVTKFFYDNHEKYLIKNFSSKINFSELNYCVDSLSDLNKIKAILENFKIEKLNLDFLISKNFLEKLN